MDKYMQFIKYRENYNEFHYNSYSLEEDSEAIYLIYQFEIPKLSKFEPKLKILKKHMNFKNINTKYAQNMAFHIGLIELISYWKATCCPNVIIKCGYLNEAQISWWKKLYFYGLGEFFYTNNIKTNIHDFMNIICTNTANKLDYEPIKDCSEGYIIPIGGGKDSVVTLEVLKVNTKNDFCLIINPKPVTLDCAKIARFENNNIIEIYRTIDKNLINLNEQDFLNGHTPFSAMLAFVSYFVAYLLGKKFIALSNENSANEANVLGEKVNHQYSKSFEFECDFENYSTTYLKAPVKYFSFLRPLNELQIAKIFARQEKYHSTFKSCNVGSKTLPWKWCCNCAKCLFAYTILSPYLNEESLIKIFGENLFEKENLLTTFLELTGNGKTKPFDCVRNFRRSKFCNKYNNSKNGKEKFSSSLSFKILQGKF